MAVNTNIVVQQMVYIQKETTNQSFLDMHYYLKRTGRVNNNFMLVLYDAGLAGVNPRDPQLPTQLKQRVLREIIVNYWYFIREVVRIPEAGGNVSGGARFRLDRGSMAMSYLFTFNYNMYVELPRQFGKTTCVVCRILWEYQFGTSYSRMMFIHKDHGGAKDNLAKLKEIRDALPSWLQMSSAIGLDGKKLKVPNTREGIEHPINHNKIDTTASARSKDAAEKMGRGATVPRQFWDEFGFIMFNDVAYTAAAPAFSKASETAKKNNAPYGIIITTTPGDLGTSQGRFAYDMRNNATPWNEAYYDYDANNLKILAESNTKSSFFLIRYTYQQLGKGNEYFNTQCRDLGNNWDKIRREILLEWSEIASNCPFAPEDLKVIKAHIREPIRQMFFGRVGQYVFNVYEDISPMYPPIIGVDVSGATFNDASAITIIDSKTTRVTATMNCNFIPTDDLADVIYILVKQYMPNAVVNIERNGGFGSSVIQRLVKTSVKKNLYYEIKEKPVEERFDGYRVNSVKRLVKVYGLDSNKSVRAQLIDLLMERSRMHRDKFVAQILYDEMSMMVVKNSGKVEHSDRTHDDQVFSLLMALYVWYYGHNVMQNFGIQKNTIQSDDMEDIEDMEGGIANETMEYIDLDKADDATLADIESQLQYIKEASKAKLNSDFQQEMYQREQEELQLNMANDPLFRKAYQEQYHEDVDCNYHPLVQLPATLFDDEDDEAAMQELEFHGNLYNTFMGNGTKLW